MKSLDPRVNRLPEINVGSVPTKQPLDQFGTFEVFVQPREGKPYQHEGAVHSPDLEMAFILAKENFTRRFTCSALWVADTRDVFVSATTEGTESIYSGIAPVDVSAEKTSYHIFHLLKRGKQHVHAVTVNACSPEDAFYQAKVLNSEAVVIYNLWAIRSDLIRMTAEEEKDLWLTLPEKKFRDASAYKGGDKLSEFLERKKM